MLHWLNEGDPFPPPSAALAEPNGLLAAGGVLSATSLITAYRAGIFPWFEPGQPPLWWSPDPRTVLFPSELKVSRSLRKRLRRRDYEIRSDTCFERVMRECAQGPERDNTWIGEAMIVAYGELHERGLAHSVETWCGNTLVGGLYGIALGRVFYGESMFARVTDASKLALVHLVHQLQRWQFGLIDCQVHTPHLASLGARALRRADFMHKLLELVNCPDLAGRWRFDENLV